MSSTLKVSIFLSMFSMCLIFYLLLPVAQDYFDPGGKWPLWTQIYEKNAMHFVLLLLFSTLASLGFIALIEQTTKRQRQRKIGEILVSLNFISEENLKKALAQQKLQLGEILVLAGHISPEQRDFALEVQKKNNKRIGEILKELGFITEEELRWALSEKSKTIGRILKDMNLVTDYDIDCALMLKKKGRMDKDGKIVDIE